MPAAIAQRASYFSLVNAISAHQDPTKTAHAIQNLLASYAIEVNTLSAEWQALAQFVRLEDIPLVPQKTNTLSLYLLAILHRSYLLSKLECAKGA